MVLSESRSASVQLRDMAKRMGNFEKEVRRDGILERFSFQVEDVTGEL